MTAEKFFSSRYGVVFSAIIATFLWGSAFPLIKLSYSDLHIEANEYSQQILFAGYRFFLAALLIFLFILITKRKLINLKKETTITLLKIGFFQTFFQYFLLYIGLSMSTGIQGSIIAGTTSFFQIILAHFMYNDDAVNWRKTIGLIIGFSGVVMVNLTKGDFQFNFGIGELLLLVGMMAAAFGNILARNGAKNMDVSSLTGYQMLFGSFGLLLFGIITAGFFPFHFDIRSAFMLFYLAFLSAAGFVLWNNIMKYNQVGKVSMYLFLIPVFGVILSSIILNEIIHIFVLMGLAFVASGIVIVNRR